MTIKLEDTMRCYVCDSTKWNNLGKVVEDAPDTKDWPELGVCKTCGNVAYLLDVSKEAGLLDFYRKDYRTNPKVGNLITTTNKQNYIMRFLGEYLEEKEKEDGFDPLICGDWGCATGYIPAALRNRGHRATGSEYTRGYRRFAEHYYGILISEELGEKHKFDLITCYHVLEHMMEPDKKLLKMKELLKDDGRILIATPEWFTDLEVQSGEELHGKWHYWHKNHINCFSNTSIKNLFAKVGLEVVTEDHIVYGQTYFLKKCEPTKIITAEDPGLMMLKIKRYNEAIVLFKTGKYEEALDLVPNFPEALINLAFIRHGKDPDTQSEVFKRAGDTMPENTRIRGAVGAWLFQQERFQDAKLVLTELFKDKPGVDSLYKIGWCHLHLKEFQAAKSAFLQCTVMNPALWKECQELAIKACCEMPHWEERGRADALRELKKTFDPKVKAIDPVMDTSGG